MFTRKALVAGLVFAGLLSAPALADGFAFGFGYSSGGYYAPAYPVYYDCGPTVVVRDYCPPPVYYYDCGPRYYSRSYYYRDCGPRYYSRPVYYKRAYYRGRCW
jgi:hypothetical protein